MCLLFATACCHGSVAGCMFDGPLAIKNTLRILPLSVLWSDVNLDALEAVVSVGIDLKLRLKLLLWSLFWFQICREILIPCFFRQKSLLDPCRELETIKILSWLLYVVVRLPVDPTWTERLASKIGLKPNYQVTGYHAWNTLLCKSSGK